VQPPEGHFGVHRAEPEAVVAGGEPADAAGAAFQSSERTALKKVAENTVLWEFNAMVDSTFIVWKGQLVLKDQEVWNL